MEAVKTLVDFTALVWMALCVYAFMIMDGGMGFGGFILIIIAGGFTLIIRKIINNFIEMAFDIGSNMMGKGK